jgi:hypothetical protein
VEYYAKCQPGDNRQQNKNFSVNRVPPTSGGKTPNILKANYKTYDPKLDALVHFLLYHTNIIL